MKVLIIEDEPDLLREIKSYLEKDDIICEIADSFPAASEKLEIYHYDIAIIDITLPEGSGLDLIRNLKNLNQDTGILIISAKNSLEDKLTGLDLGADDYLTKPFHLAELNARVKSLWRRRKLSGANEIVFQEIKISLETKMVKVHEKTINLTKKEYDLLTFFIANKSHLITKESIVEHLWGDNIDLADNYNFLYTHINNLKQKILKAQGKDYFKSVYGMGYKFTEE